MRSSKFSLFIALLLLSIVSSYSNCSGIGANFEGGSSSDSKAPKGATGGNPIVQFSILAFNSSQQDLGIKICLGEVLALNYDGSWVSLWKGSPLPVDVQKDGTPLPQLAIPENTYSKFQLKLDPSCAQVSYSLRVVNTSGTLETNSNLILAFDSPIFNSRTVSTLSLDISNFLPSLESASTSTDLVSATSSSTGSVNNLNGSHRVPLLIANYSPGNVTPPLGFQYCYQKITAKFNFPGSISQDIVLWQGTGQLADFSTALHLPTGPQVSLGDFDLPYGEFSDLYFEPSTSCFSYRGFADLSNSNGSFMANTPSGPLHFNYAGTGTGNYPSIIIDLDSIIPLLQSATSANDLEQVLNSYTGQLTP